MNKSIKHVYKLITISTFILMSLFLFTHSASAATVPTLGAAAGYSVFGKAGVTNTGALTHLWGNVGADLLASITGLVASQVDGVIDTGAGVEAGILSAYAQLDAQGATGALSLAGVQTVGPGVYTVGATTLNGNLTLSGSGVYIFRSSSNISADPGAQVTLINGANACNVFWQVPGSFTIGAGAHVEGTILTDTQLISLGTGASLVGRALSRIAQVTLDTNQITTPACSSPKLTVTKIVVGGTKVVSNFPLFINAASVTSGVQNTLATGLNTVSETSDSTYSSVIGGDCASNGTITLFSGDVKSCTITNTFITVANTSGGHRRDIAATTTSNTTSVTSSTTPVVATTTTSVATTTTPTPTITTSFTPTPVVLAVVPTTSNPKLPNAGFSPYKSNPNRTVIILGLVFLTLTSLSFTQKKA